MNNETQNNHYVPQHLLRNFADTGGKIWIYDTELKTQRYGNTKSAGFERKLYPPEVEKFLTRLVDTPGFEAITGLLKQTKLNGKQWVNFIGFVATQMQRTPSCFDRAAAVSDPMFQETAERIARDTKFQNDLRKSMEEKGASPEEIQQFLQIIGTGQFKVSSNREFLLKQSLWVVPMLSKVLLKMKWGILQIPNGEPDLVIGDHAVMLYDKGPNDIPPAPLGLSNPHIELVMPLSSRAVAVACWTGENSFGEIGIGSAKAINELTFSHARRFIFAPYKSDELLKRAIELKGTGPKIHSRIITMGKGLMILTEYR
ncbi:MAG: DUF4238 domain-containing protein [Limisphaerales bacterium]